MCRAGFVGTVTPQSPTRFVNAILIGALGNTSHMHWEARGLLGRFSTEDRTVIGGTHMQAKDREG